MATVTPVFIEPQDSGADLGTEVWQWTLTGSDDSYPIKVGHYSEVTLHFYGDATAGEVRAEGSAENWEPFPSDFSNYEPLADAKAPSTTTIDISYATAGIPPYLAMVWEHVMSLRIAQHTTAISGGSVIVRAVCSTTARRG